MLVRSGYNDTELYYDDMDGASPIRYWCVQYWNTVQRNCDSKSSCSTGRLKIRTPTHRTFETISRFKAYFFGDPPPLAGGGIQKVYQPRLHMMVQRVNRWKKMLVMYPRTSSHCDYSQDVPQSKYS